MIRFRRLSVKFFLNPCLLFFWTGGWWHLLPWNLWNLEQICYQNLPKRIKSDQRCPRGGHNRSKGVPPPGSEKQVAKKPCHPWNQSRNWLQNGSQHLKVWRILSDMFRCFAAFFFHSLKIIFLDHFGIIFSIIFMFMVFLFEACFEIASWFV